MEGKPGTPVPLQLIPAYAVEPSYAPGDGCAHALVRPPQVEALLRDTSIAFGYLSLPDMRFRYANQAFARMNRVGVERILGRTPKEILGPRAERKAYQILRREIVGESAVREIEVETEIIGCPGELAVILIDYHPVRSAAGNPEGMWFVARDITEARRMEARQRRLLAITQAVNADASLDSILRMVRDAVVDTAGFDRAGIWLYDERTDMMRGSWGTEHNGAPADETALAFPLPEDPSDPVRMLISGDIRYFLFRGLYSGPASALMPGVREYAQAAFRTGDRFVGYVSVDNLITGRPIRDEDVEVLLPFCEQAAIAIESARLREVERNRADRLAHAIRETNHRVKNNLQIVAALLDMHLMDAADSVDRAVLARTVGQIRAIAAVHDFLSHGGPQFDVNVRQVLEKLLPIVAESAGTAWRLESESVTLSEKQATSVSLAVNELVNNASKHGGGAVAVMFAARNGCCRLEVRDDGPGFPPDFDPDRNAHIGLDLVATLARWDLQGAISFENPTGGGGRVVMEFPLDIDSYSRAHSHAED